MGTLTPQVAVANSHQDILDFMQVLGYQINEGGMCFGLSHMGIQAIFANDFSRFEARRQLISIMILDARSINPENPGAVIQEMLASVSKKEKNKEALSAEEELMMEMRPFCDGVKLYQNSFNFPELFNSNSAQDEQNMAKVINLLIPTLLKDKINIQQSEAFAGVYGKDEIEIYLNFFKQITIDHEFDKRITLELSSGNHSIAIHYDKKSDEWILIDANQIIKTNVIDQMVRALNAAVSTNENAIFSTRILAANTDPNSLENHAQLILDEFKTTPTWKYLYRAELRDRVQRVDSYENNIIEVACRQRDVSLLREILKIGIDVNRISTTGISLLAQATAVEGNQEIIAELIKHGADMNFTSKKMKGLSPAEICIDRNSRKNLLALLENGLDPNANTRNDGTLLHRAVMNNNIGMATILLKHGSNVNALTAHKQTPLHFAQDKEMRALLLKHGADPNIVDFKDRKALEHKESYFKDLSSSSSTSTSNIYRNLSAVPETRNSFKNNETPRASKEKSTNDSNSNSSLKEKVAFYEKFQAVPRSRKP